jgi:hypothetical protein
VEARQHQVTVKRAGLRWICQINEGDTTRDIPPAHQSYFAQAKRATAVIPHQKGLPGV